MILVSLAAALLAGFGLEAVLQLKTPWAYFQRTVWSWAAIFLLGLACLWGFSDVLQEKMALQTTLLHDLTPERATLWARTAAKLFQVQLMQQIIFCCLLAACFWLAQRLQSKRKIILPALAFLTAADLLISGINIVWLIEDDIYTVKPPVAEHLARLHADTDPQVRFGQANEIKTIPPDFRPDLDGLLYVLPATFKAHVMEENWGLLYHLKGNYGVWPAHTFVSNIFYILYQEAAKTGNREFRHIYESLQAVKYVSAANPEPKIVEMYQSDKKYKQIAYFPELNSYLFENKTYLPRARFQHQAITVKEETEMTMIFTQPTIADFDYQKHVLLLDGPDLQQARAQVPAQEAPQKRWTPAQIGNESNNRLEITFETNTSGYLVLADQYAPGWKAWVNGVETPIIRANFMQRAVRVGPGKHRVEMRYEAPGFLLGLWISGLAAALWLVLLGFSVSRRQRRAEAESAASLPATA